MATGHLRSLPGYLPDRLRERSAGQRIVVIAVLLVTSVTLLSTHQTGQLYPYFPVGMGLSLLFVVALLTRDRPNVRLALLLVLVWGVVLRLYVFEFPAGMIGHDPDNQAVIITGMLADGSPTHIEGNFYKGAPFFYFLTTTLGMVGGLTARRALSLFPILLGLLPPLAAFVTARRVGLDGIGSVASAAFMAASGVIVIRSSAVVPEALSIALFVTGVLVLAIYLRTVSTRAIVIFGLATVALAFTHKLPVLILWFVLLGVLLLMRIDHLHTGVAILEKRVGVLTTAVGALLYYQMVVISHFLPSVTNQIADAFYNVGVALGVWSSDPGSSGAEAEIATDDSTAGADSGETAPPGDGDGDPVEPGSGEAVGNGTEWGSAPVNGSENVTGTGSGPDTPGPPGDSLPGPDVVDGSALSIQPLPVRVLYNIGYFVVTAPIVGAIWLYLFCRYRTRPALQMVLAGSAITMVATATLLFFSQKHNPQRALILAEPFIAVLVGLIVARGTSNTLHLAWLPGDPKTLGVGLLCLVLLANVMTPAVYPDASDKTREYLTEAESGAKQFGATYATGNVSSDPFMTRETTAPFTPATDRLQESTFVSMREALAAGRLPTDGSYVLYRPNVAIYRLDGSQQLRWEPGTILDGRADRVYSSGDVRLYERR